MSCNGCRALRTGCLDNCLLRPCLDRIGNPDAQGHATLFVHKYYGRTKVTKFLNEARLEDRPVLFQSLLYEACGRTVNPLFGAVGLLSRGLWAECQAAVKTVLDGSPLTPMKGTPTHLADTSALPTSPPTPICSAPGQALPEGAGGRTKRGRVKIVSNRSSVRAGSHTPPTMETLTLDPQLAASTSPLLPEEQSFPDEFGALFKRFRENTANSSEDVKCDRLPTLVSVTPGTRRSGPGPHEYQEPSWRHAKFSLTLSNSFESSTEEHGPSPHMKADLRASDTSSCLDAKLPSTPVCAERESFTVVPAGGTKRRREDHEDTPKDLKCGRLPALVPPPATLQRYRERPECHADRDAHLQLSIGTGSSAASTCFEEIGTALPIEPDLLLSDTTSPSELDTKLDAKLLNLFR